VNLRIAVLPDVMSATITQAQLEPIRTGNLDIKYSGYVHGLD